MRCYAKIRKNKIGVIASLALKGGGNRKVDGGIEHHIIYTFIYVSALPQHIFSYLLFIIL